MVELGLLITFVVTMTGVLLAGVIHVALAVDRRQRDRKGIELLRRPRPEPEKDRPIRTPATSPVR